MKNRKSHTLLAASSLLFSLVTLCGTAMADDIKREGEGTRRASLNAMELKAFPVENWSKLSDWSNGTMPSAADLNGKVILLCMWADWYSPSKRIVSQARQFAQKYGKDGLVVILIHNAKGWETATKPAFEKGLPLFSASDSKGEFRKAILSDQDPDVYVIDRAGQMRFADVEKASLSTAIESLLKETPEQAANINKSISDLARQQELESRRSQAINSSVDMTSLPELEFTPPTNDDYKKAKWPKFPSDPSNIKSLEELKREEDEPPLPVTIPDTQYITAKPELKGRVRLMYIWHPDARVSFNDMPQFDLIQRQRGRDVVVVGLLCLVNEDRGGGGTLVLEKDPDKLKKRVKDFLDNRTFGHTLAFDLQNTIYEPLVKKNVFQGGIPVPYVGIVSSDGNLRWAGWMGLPSYSAALEQILRNDPGVAARRAVEAEYIKKQEGK